MQATLLRLKLTLDCTLYLEWQNYNYLAGKGEIPLFWNFQTMATLVTRPLLMATLETRPMKLLQ